MALDCFAGYLGGCAGVIVGHPFDTVKVNLQIQDSRNPQYKGTLHCMNSLLAKEGIKGLYRGVTSPLIGVAAINAMTFGAYGFTQRNLPNPDSLASHFIAGGAAGLFQSFLCSPMELAKSRMQVCQNATTLTDCIKNIYKYEGAKGIFRGLGSTIAREIPGFGLYFWTYALLTRTEDKKPISTMHMLMAGGMAGITSWLIVYPIDVIKSRLQTDGVGGVTKYRNSYDCLVKSVKSEGYGSLFRGLSPTIIRAFPVNAATFAVVAWTVRLLSNSDNIAEKMKETESLDGCTTGTFLEAASA